MIDPFDQEVDGWFQLLIDFGNQPSSLKDKILELASVDIPNRYCLEKMIVLLKELPSNFNMLILQANSIIAGKFSGPSKTFRYTYNKISQLTQCSATSEFFSMIRQAIFYKDGIMTDPVRAYTTAPIDYDWGWTKVLIENVAVTNQGKSLRLVEIEDRYHADMQLGRYQSGLNLSFEEHRLSEFLGGTFLVLTPEKEIYYERTNLEYYDWLDSASQPEIDQLSDLIDKLHSDKQIEMKLGHRSSYDVTVKGTKEFCVSKLAEVVSAWNAITRRTDANLSNESEGSPNSVTS